MQITSWMCCLFSSLEFSMSVNGSLMTWLEIHNYENQIPLCILHQSPHIAPTTHHIYSSPIQLPDCHRLTQENLKTGFAHYHLDSNKPWKEDDDKGTINIQHIIWNVIIKPHIHIQVRVIVKQSSVLIFLFSPQSFLFVHHHYK